MNLFADFTSGLELVASTLNLILIVTGALVGTLVGTIPGIRAIHIVTLMLPVAYALKLPVETTMIFLVTLYYSCEIGDRVGGILSTGQDNPWGKLVQTGITSFIGGMISVIALIAIFFLLQFLRIQFGPAEYFALVIFAFAALSFRIGHHPLKTLMSTCIGVALATIGIDSTTGVLRFAPGVPEIYDGIEFTTIACGLFIISEVFILLESSDQKTGPSRKITRERIDWKPLLANKWTILKMALIGLFVGVLPGNGTTTAGGISDKLLQRNSTGDNVEPPHSKLTTLLARDASRNAAAGGTMVPLLALGIPGSGTSAILLGALLLYNITPGPDLFYHSSNIVWGLILASVVSNFILLIINTQFIQLFAWANTIPTYILTSSLMVLAFVGVYSLHASHLSILLMVVIGLFGYVLQSWRYPMVPLLLGFVLGKLMEDSLRRALAISGGDAAILFDSPTSRVFWLLSLLVFVLPLFWRWRKGRQS
ncbi:MAG: tripartite tricarboxylate transporter permease [Desulfuromonadales bacterium]